MGGVINILGSLLVLFAMPATASDDRVAAAWALVQFLSGVWAGVLGANTPFFHGLVAGLPALLLGLVIPSSLPPQFVVVCWALAPCRGVARGGADALHAPPGVSGVKRGQTPIPSKRGQSS